MITFSFTVLSLLFTVFTFFTFLTHFSHSLHIFHIAFTIFTLLSQSFTKPFTKPFTYDASPCSHNLIFSRLLVAGFNTYNTLRIGARILIF
jgi:hypothetical protein